MLHDDIYKIRCFLVNTIILVLKVCLPILSEKIIGYILIFLHMLLPLIMFYLYLHYPVYRLWIILISMGILISNMFFCCCILTKIEQKLTNGSITVVDPFLNFMSVSVTNKTRSSFTLIVAGLYIITLLVFYHGPAS